jgi:thiol:disulfide interchange protein
MHRGTRYTTERRIVKEFVALLVAALALAALGVTAAMHGEADDAPGLAFIGIVLIVGALAVAVSAGRRSRWR